MTILRRFHVLFCLIFVGLFAFQCTQKEAPQDPIQISYIPFGDSYTIGEGVTEVERWPNQLAKALSEGANIDVEILTNPARNGFKTHNVLHQELKVLDQYQPDFITLLIGANDHYRGVTIETFEKNLSQIFENFKRKAPQAKVLVVNIPDYSRTRLGQRMGGNAATSKSIQRFNAVIQKQADSFNYTVVNIFDISQSLGNQVVMDGLHPSAEQYKAWVEEILPVAIQVIRS